MKLESGVPVIDFSGIHGPDRKRISEQIAKACEEWGFFQIINHGVDISLMERIQTLYAEFFHLPIQEKQRWALTDSSEGWRSPQVADIALVTKIGIDAVPDSVESNYNIVLCGDPSHKDKIPTSPPALRPTLLAYANAVQAVQEEVLGAMSEELGLETDALRRHVSPPDIAIRLNFYPAKTGDNIVGTLRQHSDLPVLTFLLADKVPGLEIKKDDRWVLVEPLANAFIVNVADCLEVFSNGRFRSLEHRGGAGDQTRERLSIATFYTPSRATNVCPMPELLDESHRPRYGSRKFGQMMDEFNTEGLKGKGYVEALKIQT